MNAVQFRRLATSLPEVVEQAHCGHPDFRVGGRIFSSLNAQETRATLKLTAEQQRELLAAHPELMTPAAGAWGRAGWTQLLLKPARVAVARQALIWAWSQTAPARVLDRGGQREAAGRREPEAAKPPRVRNSRRPGANRQRAGGAPGN